MKSRSIIIVITAVAAALTIAATSAGSMPSSTTGAVASAGAAAGGRSQRSTSVSSPHSSASKPNTRPMPKAEICRPHARLSMAQVGDSPCFLGGFCCTLVRRISSARTSRGRVSQGSMTSSIWPTSAAR